LKKNESLVDEIRNLNKEKAEFDSFMKSYEPALNGIAERINRTPVYKSSSNVNSCKSSFFTLGLCIKICRESVLSSDGTLSQQRVVSSEASQRVISPLTAVTLGQAVESSEIGSQRVASPLTAVMSSNTDKRHRWLNMSPWEFSYWIPMSMFKRLSKAKFMTSYV
jgi:hypothetical protein